MSVHNGHRERLRARFLNNGLAGFEEHTALELILFYARPRCNTNEIAHNLIKRFGSFSAVLDAPIEELITVEGIGQTSALLLKLIPELGAYYLENRSSPGVILDSTIKAGEFFIPKFLGKTSEMLFCASLDDKRKVIRCTCLSEEGIVNAVPVSVKRIVTEAVNANATGIILAHNHPAGLALPSTGDRQVTKQIYNALQYINVQLVDHLVVADGDFVSMADSGYIEIIRRDFTGGR